MRKQLIIVTCIFLAAIILFCSYYFLLRDDPLTEGSDEYISPSIRVLEVLMSLEDKIEITLQGISEKELESDIYRLQVHYLLKGFAVANDKITLSVEEKGESGIKVEKGSEERFIPDSQIYYFTYYYTEEGEYWKHDTEKLLSDAIAELCGLDKLDGISMHAFAGKDLNSGKNTDSSGNIYIYPYYQRSDIYSISIKNTFDSFKVYKGVDGNHCIEGGESLTINGESFSKLIVYSGMMQASECIVDYEDASDYGLGEDDEPYASITLVTNSNIKYTMNIGKLNPSGTGFYTKRTDEDIINVVHYTFLYDTILMPAVYFFEAAMLYTITTETDYLKVSHIELEKLEENQKLVLDAYSQLTFSENTAGYDSSTDVLTLYTDRKLFTDAYTSWKDQAALGGITTSDGKRISVQSTLVKYSDNGKYKVSFGLLRDEANNACMPSSFKFEISTDGYNFKEAESGVSFSQSNGELKRYSIEFESAEPVKEVRLTFGIDKGSFIVLDEISVMAGTSDATPDEGIVGGYKISEPAEHVSEGRNYMFAPLDVSTDFVIPLITLADATAVDFRICENPKKPETMNIEKLAEYGLDKPAYHASFEYDGKKNDIYISAGKWSDTSESYNYHCYTIITDLDTGASECTNLVALLTLDSQPWLQWEIQQFLSSSVYSKHINSVDEMTFSYLKNGENISYTFLLDRNEEGNFETVTLNGEVLDTQMFRYLFQHLLSVYGRGGYDSSQGTEGMAEMITVTDKGPLGSTKTTIYRYSSTLACYENDGQIGPYYVLVSDVNRLITALETYASGGTIKRP